MPLYTFLNTQTNEQYDMMLSISAREQYLIDNPHVKQLLTGAPTLHSGNGINGRKPDDAFRDKLKEIKKAHSRGYSQRAKSTVNTF